MFSLLKDPWLRLSLATGGPMRAYSLREAVLEAHALGDLVVDLPTQRPSLLRQLLLPVIVDALGRPADGREWVRWFHAGRWSPQQVEQLNAYFATYQDRFDLFHPTDPFAQVADLQTEKGETKGAGLLVATAATGNNVPLFASRTEGDVLALTPAEAAHWLLHIHGWDTAAIKTGAVGDPKVKQGKTTGNPTGPLGQLGVTVPVGRTLYDTLLLNIPVGPPLRSDDLPQWRRRDQDGPIEETCSVATPLWQERAPKGLLDVWTWQSRRIRLFPKRSDDGTLSVSRVLVAAGDRMPHTPEDEPHTMWRLEPTGTSGRAKSNKRAGALPRRSLRMQAGKAAWRGLDALLAPERASQDASDKTAGFATSRLLDQLAGVRSDIGEAYPLRVELTGMAYGTQSSTVDDVMFDSLPLPLAALGAQTYVHAAVVEAAAQAEQLAVAVNNLSADLRRALGADPIPWDKGQRPGEFVLHALDPLMRRLLAGLRDVGDDIATVEARQTEWEQLAWRRSWEIADGLLQTVPVSAYTGRKSDKKEGGDKPERTYRASMAEASFLRRRREILHRAAEARRLAQAERTTLAQGSTGPVADGEPLS
ncbi:type I-E CRISPR-associated protein Cse1/CasA [Streptomyces sp. NPDC008240]|uniref:type I-E CRISPR-associated protein Cse1/CasA n=1 Tax=Streptomyces sp. NPDC008240 TaxID=3364822 RepID=UPI0036EAE900